MRPDFARVLFAAGLAAAAGCNVIFGIEPGEPRATGTGGGGHGASGGGGHGAGTSECPPLFEGHAPEDCQTDGAHDYASDPNNCCVTGHSCLGGDCFSGECQAVVLHTSSSAPEDESLGIVVEGDSPDDRVVFANGIGRSLFSIAKKPGTTAKTLISLQEVATQLAIQGSSVFVSDFSSSLVRRVPLQGAAIVEVIAAADPTHGETQFGKITAHGNWVLWATVAPGASDTNRLWAARIDMPGSPPVLVAGTDSFRIGAMGADDTHVYWTEMDLTGQTPVLRRATLGSPPGAAETVATASSPAQWPGDVFVTDRVYWFTSNALNVTDKDGKNAGALAQADGPHGMVVDGASIYWLDEFGNKLRRVRRSGGAVDTVGEASESLGIAQDCRAVFWTSNATGARFVRMIAK